MHAWINLMRKCSFVFPSLARPSGTPSMASLHWCEGNTVCCHLGYQQQQSSQLSSPFKPVRKRSYLRLAAIKTPEEALERQGARLHHNKRVHDLLHAIRPGFSLSLPLAYSCRHKAFSVSDVAGVWPRARITYSRAPWQFQVFRNVSEFSKGSRYNSWLSLPPWGPWEHGTSHSSWLVLMVKGKKTSQCFITRLIVCSLYSIRVSVYHHHRTVGAIHTLQCFSVTARWQEKYLWKMCIST